MLGQLCATDAPQAGLGDGAAEAEGGGQGRVDVQAGADGSALPASSPAACQPCGDSGSGKGGGATCSPAPAAADQQAEESTGCEVDAGSGEGSSQYSDSQGAKHGSPASSGLRLDNVLNAAAAHAADLLHLLELKEGEVQRLESTVDTLKGRLLIMEGDAEACRACSMHYLEQMLARSEEALARLRWRVTERQRAEGCASSPQRSPGPLPGSPHRTWSAGASGSPQRTWSAGTGPHTPSAATVAVSPLRSARG